MKPKAVFRDNTFFCPECEVKLRRIIYGLIRKAPEEVKRGEAILGGCMMGETIRDCPRCKRRFAAYELPLEFFKPKESPPYTPDEFDKYISQLLSPDADQMRAALTVFEFHAVTQALPAIRSRIATTENAFTRSDLVQALWVIGGEAVVEDLVGYLEDAHKWVRREAGQGLRFLALEGNEAASVYLARVEAVLAEPR